MSNLINPRPPIDGPEHYLCLSCREWIPIEEVTEQTMGCPRCGSESIPGSSKSSGNFLITFQELRVITMWAEFWANSHKDTNPGMLKTVHQIAGDLQMQVPECPTLTLAGELGEIKERFGEGNVETSENFPKFQD